jgi:hypothetical protein
MRLGQVGYETETFLQAAQFTDGLKSLRTARAA